MIKADGRTIRSEIHTFINYISNKEELPEEWKWSIIVPIYKKGKSTIIYNYKGISVLSTIHNMLSNIPIHIQRTLLATISVDFDTPGQPLITHSTFVEYSRGKKWEYREAVHQLLIDFKKAYDSVWREALYNILTETGKANKNVSE
jgi:hypothetical protein